MLTYFKIESTTYVKKISLVKRLSRIIGKLFWFYHIDYVLGELYRKGVLNSKMLHLLDDELKYKVYK